MEFGYLDNVDGLDLKLPDDHPLTHSTLSNYKTNQAPRIFYGTSKFGRKDWVGSFFPPKTKDRDFLLNYVKHFNSIELNATHHRFPPSNWISKWKNEASEEFRFCPKIYKAISHRYRLKNCERLSNDFYLRVQEFEYGLGPLFMQFPDNFSGKSFPDLVNFIRDKPKEINLNIEFRHPEWFEESSLATETFAALRENHIGTVITDTPGRRDVLHMHLTSPIAFIRFVGGGLHKSDFSRIEQWVERLDQWFHLGLREAYFFMHQHDDLATPKALDFFVEKVNQKMSLDLHRPLAGIDID